MTTEQYTEEDASKLGIIKNVRKMPICCEGYDNGYGTHKGCEYYVCKGSGWCNLSRTFDDRTVEELQKNRRANCPLVSTEV